MNLFAALAMVVALLATPISNAAAATIDLFDNFPWSFQGQNGFSAGAYNPTTGTYTALTKNPGAVIMWWRSASSPYVPEVWVTSSINAILLDASASEWAVLSYSPNAPSRVNASASFNVGSSSVPAIDVYVGTMTGNSFHQLGTATLYGDPQSGQKSNEGFTLNNIFVDQSTSLWFAVGLPQGQEAGQGWLNGTIETNPVPVPSALLLLGSGLLCLAGWRRKFRN